MTQPSSQVFSSVQVTDSLSIGTAGASSTAVKCKVSFDANVTPLALGPTGRQRFASVYDATDSKKATMAIPRGHVVRGLTIKPYNDATLATLKSLPTRVTGATGISTPCGEIALSIHRTATDNAAMTPAGTYVLGGSTGHNSETGVASGSSYVTMGANTDTFNEYFKYFVVNSNGAQVASGNIGGSAPWDSLEYRQAVPASQMIQAGSPVVHVDASRSLFGNLGTVADSSAGVYVPFTMSSGLVSDGSWGLALGLIAQCEYNANTGASKWPEIKFDVTVHLDSVA
jgi:hypothetical protein